MVLLFLLSEWACKKTEDPHSFTTGYWVVNMNAPNLVPGDSSRNDQAYAALSLMDDSLLYYDIYFTTTTGQPSSVSLYQGLPVENGVLLAQFTGLAFDADNKAVGHFPLGNAAVDSLHSSGSVFYLVVNGSGGSGLVRGRLGTATSFARDVAMDGSQVMPAVSTDAVGLTLLRLMADNVSLYYNVQITGVPDGDVLTSAAIRKKADNSILLQLASSPTDFNTPKLMTIASASATSLKSDSLYVDIRSTLYPAGLIRGKLR